MSYTTQFEEGFLKVILWPWRTIWKPRWALTTDRKGISNQIGATSRSEADLRVVFWTWETKKIADIEKDHHLTVAYLRLGVTTAPANGNRPSLKVPDRWRQEIESLSMLLIHDVEQLKKGKDTSRCYTITSQEISPFVDNMAGDDNMQIRATPLYRIKIIFGISPLTRSKAVCLDGL